MARKLFGDNKPIVQATTTGHYTAHTVEIKNVSGCVNVTTDPDAHDVVIEITGYDEENILDLGPDEHGGIVTFDGLIARVAAFYADRLSDRMKSNSARRALKGLIERAAFTFTLTLPEGTNLILDGFVGDLTGDGSTLGDVCLRARVDFGAELKPLRLGFVKNLEVDVIGRSLIVDSVTGSALVVKAGYKSKVTIKDGDIAYLAIAADWAVVGYGGKAAGGSIDCAGKCVVHVKQMDGHVDVKSSPLSKITIDGGEAKVIIVNAQGTELVCNGTAERVLVFLSGNTKCVFGAVAKLLEGRGDCDKVMIAGGDTEEVYITGIELEHPGRVNSGSITPGKGTVCHVGALGPDVVIEDATVSVAIIGNPG